LSSEIDLADLRQALAAYPLETPEQSEVIVAAAREYEPLVDSVMLFALDTGKRLNDLIVTWIGSR